MVWKCAPCSEGRRPVNMLRCVGSVQHSVAYARSKVMARARSPSRKGVAGRAPVRRVSDRARNESTTSSTIPRIISTSRARGAGRDEHETPVPGNRYRRAWVPILRAQRHQSESTSTPARPWLPRGGILMRRGCPPWHRPILRKSGWGLHERLAQDAVREAGAAAEALAGTLVVARAEARPGGGMASGGQA